MTEQHPTIPSFVEQMAKRHYDETDANARAVPWEDMIPIRRELLIRVMGDIVDLAIDTMEDE